jgi:hypothetical protein
MYTKELEEERTAVIRANQNSTRKGLYNEGKKQVLIKFGIH